MFIPKYRSITDSDSDCDTDTYTFMPPTRTSSKGFHWNDRAMDRGEDSGQEGARHAAKGDDLCDTKHLVCINVSYISIL